MKGMAIYKCFIILAILVFAFSQNGCQNNSQGSGEPSASIEPEVEKNALTEPAQYLMDNETIVASFETVNGKKVVLAKDSNNTYLVYRYGTLDKIEMEYPDMNKDSWKKFKYSFYMRGGGIDNEGMDLNYLYFDKDGFRYVVYYTYSAVDEKSRIGIMVINLATNKTTDIIGKEGTWQGDLVDFRLNGLLEITDELF